LTLVASTPTGANSPGHPCHPTRTCAAFNTDTGCPPYTIFKHHSITLPLLFQSRGAEGAGLRLARTVTLKTLSSCLAPLKEEEERDQERILPVWAGQNW